MFLVNFLHFFQFSDPSLLLDSWFSLVRFLLYFPLFSFPKLQFSFTFSHFQYFILFSFSFFPFSFLIRHFLFLLFNFLFPLYSFPILPIFLFLFQILISNTSIFSFFLFIFFHCSSHSSLWFQSFVSSPSFRFSIFFLHSSARDEPHSFFLPISITLRSCSYFLKFPVFCFPDLLSEPQVAPSTLLFHLSIFHG